MKINSKLRSILKPREAGFPETIWKLATVVWSAVFIIVSVSVLVFLISKKSVYDEIEYVIIIVSIIMFLFLVMGLYSGAKIRGKPSTPQLKFLGKAFDFSSGIDGLDFDFDGGPLAWLVTTIFVVVLFGLFSTIIWAAFLILVFIFSWVVYRAVRLVLIKGIVCKGDLKKSILFAAQYALLYSGWIFGIVWIVEHKPWKYFNH
jgi:hypothetical protein